MRSNGYSTPVPRRANELKATKPSEVVTYQLSADELAKYRALPAPDNKDVKKQIEIKTKSKEENDMAAVKDGPACGLTKDILIEQVAKGETLSSIERAWGMKYNTIHNWVKKWGLKGINPAKAQELLDELKQPVMREKDALQNDAVKAEVYQQTTEMLKKEKSALEDDLAKVRSELEQAVSKIYDLERQLSLSREANSALKDEYDRLLQEREELPTAQEPYDPVNHPSHYTRGDIECIDAIEAATAGLSGPEAYSTGAAIKYLWRWKHKNGREDLQKAVWYVNRLIGE